MRFKGACDNCGYVGMYQAPIKAKLIPYNADEGKTEHPGVSHYIDAGGHHQVLMCGNCGLPMLEIGYWNESADKKPFGDEVQIVTSPLAGGEPEV